MKKRPLGLTIFAVINFILAVLGAAGSILYISPYGPRMSNAGIMDLAYTIISPTITTILLVVSGIGFLRVSYRAGFICGITFAIISLGHVMHFNILCQFSGFWLRIPSMVYPMILLLMLPFKYKSVFLAEKHRKSAGQDTEL